MAGVSSLLAISRKTGKGLPQYLDKQESDVFVLFGAEGLVPMFEKDAASNWVIKDAKPFINDGQHAIAGMIYPVCPYSQRKYSSMNAMAILRTTPENGFLKFITMR